MLLFLVDGAYTVAHSSLYQPIYQSAYQSIYHSIYHYISANLLFCLSVCLSAYLSFCVYLSAYLPFYPSLYLSAYLPVYLSLYQRICHSMYQSICQSILLSVPGASYTARTLHREAWKPAPPPLCSTFRMKRPTRKEGFQFPALTFRRVTLEPLHLTSGALGIDLCPLQWSGEASNVSVGRDG